MTMILDPSDEMQTNGAPHRPFVEETDGRRPRPSRLASRGDFWTDAAPKRLRRGGLTASAAWQVLWSKRRPQQSHAKLLGGKSTPLAWGVDVSSPG